MKNLDGFIPVETLEELKKFPAGTKVLATPPAPVLKEWLRKIEGVLQKPYSGKDVQGKIGWGAMGVTIKWVFPSDGKDTLDRNHIFSFHTDATIAAWKLRVQRTNSPVHKDVDDPDWKYSLD